MSGRLVFGLFLAVLAGMMVSYVIDSLRGDDWDTVSALLISVFAVAGAFLFARNRPGAKYNG